MFRNFQQTSSIEQQITLGALAVLLAILLQYSTATSMASTVTLAESAKKYANIVDKEGKRSSWQLAVTQDGKNVYAVSLIGVDQPSFSFFHRTHLTGGTVCQFDTTAKKWVAKSEVPALDTEENREDVIVVRDNVMYMVVYSRYTKFEYRHVYRWTGGKWEELEITKDPSVTYSDSYRSYLQVVDSLDKEDDNAILVVVDCNGQSIVDRIQLPENQGDKCVVKRIGSVMGGSTGRRSHGFRAVTACKSDGRVFIMGGSEGCGFRWEPNVLDVLEIKKETEEISMLSSDNVKELKITNTPPPWGFNGVSLTGTPNGKWTFLGGSCQEGEATVIPNGEVYELSISPTAASWVKSNRTLSSTGTYYGTVDSKGNLYLEKDDQLVVMNVN